MNTKLKIILFTISLFVLSCTKKEPALVIPPTPVIPEAPLPPTIAMSVDVSIVNRALLGDEVGVNMNYLLDDAIIAGNTASKTADGLKSMGAKILRYPGGEKSDNYYFSSPPYTASAPRVINCLFPVKDGNGRFVNGDYTAKNEVLDFDEFMQVCTKVGAKPLIVVAYDAMYVDATWCSGAARPTKAILIAHAKEWVKYANITKGYGIKLWMIGNESFHQGHGNTTASQYALDIAEFADAMRTVDPSIKIIANGKGDWWQTIVGSDAAPKIDFLAISNYLPTNISSYDTYRTNTQSLNAETDAAVNAIRNSTNVADRNRIKVIESEFNSVDFFNKKWESVNNLGHALCNFEMLGNALRSSRMYHACLWNTRWINSETNTSDLYDALKANGQLNATGTSLSIWGNNLLTQMVSASSTIGIKGYATYNPTNQNLKLFYLNKETSRREIQIKIDNFPNNYKYDVWEFKGTGIDDIAPTWGNKAINLDGNAASKLILPANSVTMLVCRP